ncbi:unnamed protein product [Spirodela intermedia]|uniref:Uncharacterized protein n=1 Tax=Spirodela intermedia TaxID=51605 RepID=A0A7I8KTB7_SPIIN|nr:unnamed protein product [Spirodela intermedia]
MGAGGGHSAAVVTAPEESREVWRRNMGLELPGILEALDSAPTRRWTLSSPGSSTRPAVRRNVDNLKLIQLGFSFFGDGGRRRHRLEQGKKRGGRLGGPLRVTAAMRLGGAVQAPVGDVPGALRSGVPGEATHRGAPLPPTIPGFTQLGWATLGRVIAVKYLTRFCGGFHLGLARLAETVGVKLEGGAAHQAGVDALLTASVFEEIEQEEELFIESKYSN